MAKDDDLLEEAREAYKECVDGDAAIGNRRDALDDLRFARLDEQWDAKVRSDRERANLPCLTINKLQAVIRQVVNDQRENKPSIKVHPVDSGADVATAKVLDGLIRNIEVASDADVAYDTAADFAVSAGFGYWRVGIDWAHYDSFDKDIRIERVGNPFSVWGDPRSQAADSSDWNVAFVTDLYTKDEFQARWKGAETVNWDDLGYGRLDHPWIENGDIVVAEWWRREETAITLLKLSNGEIVDRAEFEAAADLFQALGITVAADRPAKGFKVTQRIVTGAEVLETNPWAGRWIPIVPVYGDEVNIEGKRYFRSLIRSAKDPQRMFNYWRTTSTEVVAQQPRVPYLLPEEGMPEDKAEAAKWDTANTGRWSYLMFRGAVPPERQPMPAQAIGMMQEALAAADDIKAVTGLYDASLGQRSNETSGKAIMARQREGDVSTFHFIDNVSRAIRHTGRILLDLIPRVYTRGRIIRVLGEDGTATTVQLGQAGARAPAGQPGAPPPPDAASQPAPGQSSPVPPLAGDAAAGLPAGAERIYDLSAGKYDLTVTAGPSYTTRRQEAAEQMMTLIQQYPAAAPVIGDLLVKNLDWPGADEIAERLKGMMGQQGGDPQAAAKMQQELQQLAQENASLKLQLEDKARQRELDQGRLQIDSYKAETDRMEAAHRLIQAQQRPAPMAPGYPVQ